jgi:hypothetical protein
LVDEDSNAPENVDDVPPALPKRQARAGPNRRQLTGDRARAEPPERVDPASPYERARWEALDID